MSVKFVNNLKSEKRRQLTARDIPHNSFGVVEKNVGESSIEIGTLVYRDHCGKVHFPENGTWTSAPEKHIVRPVNVTITIDSYAD